jgi:hypothetical protein
LYDHLDEYKNLHFEIEQGIPISSKNYEESGYNLDLDLLPSCINYVFHILGEVA